ATMLGPSMWNIVIILGAVYWTRYARVIRGEVLSLREREFVKLAEIAGASKARVIRRHIVPNVLNTAMVLASLTIGVVIIAEASLSFLGVGVPPLLQVTDLETHYVSFGGARLIKAVDRVSFTLNEGETLGIVGESGCGKTTTCLSIVGLLPSAARIVGGRIEFAGKNLTQLRQSEMRRIRGAQIAMILQDPMASLNPLFSIYTQVAEPAYYHQSIRGRSLRQRVRQLLDAVRIPSPAQRMREYPHQMSGGMRQRI